MREATDGMLQRVDAMESELGALVDSLRTGANRLSADLSLLAGNMGELYEAASGPGRHGRCPTSRRSSSRRSRSPPSRTTSSERRARRRAAPADGSGEDDVEGARLIALNMALNGQSRAETDKYLAENFDLADRAGLLDEVYATVEG